MSIEHKEFAGVIGFFLLAALPIGLLVSCDRKTATANSSTTTQPSTQPATDPKLQTSVPSVSGVLPDDPNARLPVELTGPELQKLVTELDYLESSWNALRERSQAFDKDYAVISSDAVEQSLWGRVHGRGFMDKQLPLDWARLIKGQGVPTPLMQLQAFLKTQFYETGLLFDDVSARVRSVRTDLLGGAVVKYDVSFVHEFQRRVDTVDQYLDGSEAALTNLFSRYNAEFPESQVEFERIHKRNVHPANLSAESAQKLLEEIESLTDDLAKLPATEHMLESRIQVFDRTFTEIAREAGDATLLRYLAQRTNQRTSGITFNQPRPLAQLLNDMPTHALRDKTLIAKTWKAVTFGLPNYWQTADFQFPEVPSPNALPTALAVGVRGLASVRATIKDEPTRLTVDRVEHVSEVRRWYQDQMAYFEKGHALLDQIQELVKEEGLPLGWDAAPHSFDGGPSLLDKGFDTYRYPNLTNDDDATWEAELTKRTEDILKFLQECDRGSSKPSFDDFYGVDGFLSKKIPLLWRRELRRRVCATQTIVAVPIDQYDVTAPKKYEPIHFRHLQIDEDFNVTWK